MCLCCLRPSTSATGTHVGQYGTHVLEQEPMGGQVGARRADDASGTGVGRARRGGGERGYEYVPVLPPPEHPRHCRARRTPRACMKLSLWTGECVIERGGGGERGVLTSVFKVSSKGEVHDASVKGELQPQLRLTAALRPPMP